MLAHRNYIMADFGCCQPEGDLVPLSMGEVVRHLMHSVEEWKNGGFPLVSESAYVERTRTCKICDDYKWFQCKQCRCIIYSKAKLATEKCPRGLWRKLS